MDLKTNNHSVFSMFYHLALVTKYRKKVINSEASEFLKNKFEELAVNHNIHLIEWNHDSLLNDHIHVLFEAEPNSELPKFINAYKSASSRLVKKKKFHLLNLSFGKNLFGVIFFA